MGNFYSNLETYAYKKSYEIPLKAVGHFSMRKFAVSKLKVHCGRILGIESEIIEKKEDRGEMRREK